MTKLEDTKAVLASAADVAAQPENRRLGAQITFGVLAFFVFVGILYPAPLPILFLGAVLGSLSALVAMGIVLIYRANRIVNFAQGDLGGIAAVLAASLIVGSGWSFFPAVLAGLLAALAIGGVTEIAIIRRFGKAPRLILTVATIGLQQIFAATQLALPKLFDFDLVPQPPVPFDFSFEWFPATFRAGHLLVLIVVPVVMTGLILFFRYTDIGIAVRAQAESADRASLLGVPTKRIGTLVWVMAAGMSGLGVLLRLPIQGVNIGDVVGPSLMLRALAAAVIARMESLPVVLGASIVLGMVEQAVLFETGRTVVVDAVMLFVILGALLFQHRPKLSRAAEAGASTWAALREVRPIPRELARLPEVRLSLMAGGLAIAAFLLVAPLRMTEGTVNLFAVGLIVAMIIMSLVVLTGWAGQISLGQLAFVAFGAAVAGTLAQQGREFFLTLLIAGLVGAGVALAVGIPALRIRGLLLAVTTLAFALTTGSFFLNPEFFGWLVPDPGIRVLRPVIFGKFNLESEHTFYYFVLVSTVLVIGAVWSLRHSRTGRALVALRDNQRAAQSFGINRVRAELTAFAVAGFLAALAGGIFFYHQHNLPGFALDITRNLQIFSVAVIGGLGSIPGALLGASYQTILDHSPFTAAPASRLLASGAGLLFILMVLPAGLGGLVYDIRDGLLRRVARRRSIVVPSLLADIRIDDDGTVTSPIPQAARAPAATRGAKTARPADPVVAVSNLDVSYGKAQVLFGVDFHVERGEIVALLGTNGAGKSTLLGAISGLVAVQSGTITFEDTDITKDGPNATVERGLVLMPGARGVFPTLTVEENLRLAAWLFRKDPAYVKEATEQVLRYFPVLEQRWRQRAGDLSGGEQQMLTLGQVFLAKPKVLMIDELSLGLAPVVVDQLLGIVRAINEQGTAVVLVEQSVNLAITLAGRAVFLEKGEVRFEGPTKDLLDRPDILRAVFLQGEGRRRRGKPKFDPVCSNCGREHGVKLEVSELSVSFGGIQATDGVSFGVREHQILGIIGPNGAGKTTVFDAISGFVEPSSGRVVVDGTDVTAMGPDARAVLGLGRSFQDARLFPSMTVRQAIATAMERHLDVRDPLAALLMSPAVRFSEKENAKRVDELIETLNLEAFADKFVGELSTGSRRIVDIACTLAHDPKVLLLDEPSSGLAQRETEALAPVLLDIREQTGAAIVVIEHDIPLVTSVSDELLALDLGRVVAQGRPDKVIKNRAVVEGYLGSSTAVVKRSGKRAASGKGTKSRGPQRRSNGRRPAVPRKRARKVSGAKP